MRRRELSSCDNEQKVVVMSSQKGECDGRDEENRKLASQLIALEQRVNAM